MPLEERKRSAGSSDDPPSKKQKKTDTREQQRSPSPSSTRSFNALQHPSPGIGAGFGEGSADFQQSLVGHLAGMPLIFTAESLSFLPGQPSANKGVEDIKRKIKEHEQTIEGMNEGLLGTSLYQELKETNQKIIEELKQELLKQQPSSSSLPEKLSTRHDASTSRAGEPSSSGVNEGERHAEPGSPQDTGKITESERKFLKEIADQIVIDLAKKTRNWSGNRGPREKAFQAITASCNKIRSFYELFGKFTLKKMQGLYPVKTEDKAYDAAIDLIKALNNNFFLNDDSIKEEQKNLVADYRDKINKCFLDAGLSAEEANFVMIPKDASAQNRISTP